MTERLMTERPMTERKVITRAEVAELLGITPERLRQTGPRLRREHGFPPSLPGSGGRRYALALVVAWIDRRPTDPASTTPEADASAFERTLLARAAAMAAG